MLIDQLVTIVDPQALLDVLVLRLFVSGYGSKYMDE